VNREKDGQGRSILEKATLVLAPRLVWTFCRRELRREGSKKKGRKEGRENERRQEEVCLFGVLPNLSKPKVRHVPHLWRA
jgi:hypothetical protein